MLYYIFIILFIALVLFGTLFIVKQQSAAVVERFGKFISVRQSGLQIKIPIVDRVAGRLSLRVQQLDVVVETKTKDDVFVKVKVSVQFKRDFRGVRPQQNRKFRKVLVFSRIQCKKHQNGLKNK